MSQSMFEIKGNGNIVSQEIKVSSFIQLQLQITGKSLIELYQSDDEKVVIKTDENLQEYFYAGNAGSTLFVSTTGFRKPIFTKCKVKVYLRQVEKLDIRNENTDLVCSKPIILSNPIEINIRCIGYTELNIVAPKINIVSQSIGNTTIKGKCQSLNIRNQSEGDFSSKELIAEEVLITNMAVGNVELFANKEIKIGHYGLGSVSYYGDAVLKDVKQYGDGIIEHKEL